MKYEVKVYMNQKKKGEKNMAKNEICERVLDKLYDKHMCVITYADSLPDTYLEDMKNIFESDPEKDTVSNVQWATDIDGWNADGVLTLINGFSKDEACEKLKEYAKEKDLIGWNLVYKDENGEYVEVTYDTSEDDYFDVMDVVLCSDGCIWDGLFNINDFDWCLVKPGLEG